MNQDFISLLKNFVPPRYDQEYQNIKSSVAVIYPMEHCAVTGDAESGLTQIQSPPTNCSGKSLGFITSQSDTE